MSGLAAIEGKGGARARVVASLRAAVRTGRLGHAYLITGPVGAGKQEVAQALAAAHLCPEAHAAGDACGACRHCRLLASGQHADLARLEEGEGRVVPIEAVRGLLDTLSLAPVEGPGRAAIIEPAHALHPAGQNALLKTLEEPPAGTLLLLVSTRPDLLLPTIRSRCMHVRLSLAGLAPGGGLGAGDGAGDGAATSGDAEIAAALQEVASLLVDPRQGDPYERAERALERIEAVAERDEATRTPTEKRRRATLAGLDVLVGRLGARVRGMAERGQPIFRLERAIARVLAAADHVEGNAPPLLALEVLAVDLDCLAMRRGRGVAPAGSQRA